MPDRGNVIRHFQDAIEASGNNNKWRFVRLDIIEDAIKLLKEQEPRMLTLDEVKASTGKDLILEYSPWECVDSFVTAATIEGCDRKGVSFVASVACDYTAYNRKHSLGWRCWSAKPTEEERKKVQWDD